jgi:succinate dehydrogenase/fumarate reductase cytochrome b subunit
VSPDEDRYAFWATGNESVFPRTKTTSDSTVTTTVVFIILVVVVVVVVLRYKTYG